MGASGGGLRVASDADIQARFARFMETQEMPAEYADEATPSAADSDGGADEKAA
jgi:hypothetical protein